MTSLADVFVEIRPSTTGFSSELKGVLAKSKDTVTVAAKLDPKQFQAQVQTLKASLKSLTANKARIDADSSLATATVKALKLDLGKLNTKVKVEGSTEALTASIAKLKADLLSVSDVKARLNVDSAMASAKLKAVRAEATDLDRFDPTIDVKVKGPDGKDGVAFDPAMVLGAYKIPAVVTALTLAGTAVASLGAAAVGAASAAAPLVGLYAAYPAVMIAAQQGIKTVTFAMQGMGEAIKALSDPDMDPKEVAKKLRGMSPAAIDLARQIVALTKGPLKDLKQSLQTAIAPGFSAGLRSISILFPILNHQMTGTATAIGRLGAEAGRSFSSPFFSNQLARIMKTNNVVIGNAGRAAFSLGHALADIVDAFRPVLVSMSEYARRGADFVQASTRAGLATGALGAFFQRSWKLARQFGSVIADVAVGVFNVGRAGSEMGRSLGAGIAGAAAKFREWTGSIKGQASLRQYFADAIPVVHEVVRLVRDIVTGFVGMAANPTLVPVLAQIRTELLPAIQALAAGVITSFGPALVSAATAFVNFNNVLSFSPLAGLLQQMSNAVNFITGAAAKAPAPLNMLLSSLLALSLGIKAAAFAGGRLASAFGPMATAINLVATAQGRLTLATKLNIFWTKAQAVATKVAIVASAAFAAVMRVVNMVLRRNPIGIVITVLAALGAGLVIAYKRSATFRAVVDKSWAVIRRAVSVAWKDYIKPALMAMGRFIIGSLIPTVLKLWRGVIKPAFAGIGRIIKFTWNNVVKPLFGAWKAYLTNVLFPVLRFLWNRVVKPVFSGLGKTISNVWRNVVKPTFEALRRGVGLVKDGFRAAVNAIGRIWAKIKEMAARPVRFIVNTVYGAIRRVVSALPGKMELPRVKFARGGWTGPGARMKPAGIVHADEFVIRKDSRRRIERRAPGLLEAMNRSGDRALHGSLRKLPGYWLGGGVKPAAGSVSRHSGYGWARWAGDINEPGGADYGHPVVAYKGGSVSSVKHLTSSYGSHIRINHPGNEKTLYAHLSRIVAAVGQSVVRGQKIGEKGSTGNSSGPHLHFELAGGSDPIGSGSGGGLGGRFGMGYSGPSKADLFGMLHLSDWKQRLQSMGGWGPMLKGFVGNIVGRVKTYAGNKVDAAIKTAGRALTGGAGPSAGGPLQKQAAIMARNQYGWTGRNWTSLRSLVQSESGWNPKAQNPTSTAYGLFQFLNSTWAGTGIAKTSNPTAQMVAGMRYIKNRYGNPNAAWGFKQSHNWYDEGGIARGTGFLPKSTPLPERVLSPRQTESFERLTSALERLDAKRGGDGSAVFHLYDSDGALMGTMRGVARGEVDGRRAFTGTQARMSR